MADPVTSPNGSGPSTLILENQSRTVSSHTDVRVHEEINQLHGTHHKLDLAESGGAVMLGKPVLQHASDETRSLQNHQMEDKDRDSEPDRNNMSPAGKVRVLIKTIGSSHRILIMRNCMSLELMRFQDLGRKRK